METNKKNLGNPLALYPEPTTVAGAEIERKANQLAAGHTGVIGHDRIPVSLSKSHHTNQGIKKAKRLFVNLVSRDMLPKADHVGSVSGATVDRQVGSVGLPDTQSDSPPPEKPALSNIVAVPLNETRRRLIRFSEALTKRTADNSPSDRSPPCGRQRFPFRYRYPRARGRSAIRSSPSGPLSVPGS